MYSRQIDEPPLHIIENGKAHFGTFSGVSPKIDIKGMRAPYAGVPLPAFISNLRIKSRLVNVFSFGNFIGLTDFFDMKVFGLAEVIFWNRETGKKYAYHTIMPTRRRFVPMNTSQAVCASYRKSRMIKLFWRSNHKSVTNEFDLKGDSVRPSVSAFIRSVQNDPMHTDLMFVNPAPTSSRCTASWLSSMQIKGNLVTYTKDSRSEKKTENGLALMTLNRSYFKFHSTHEFVSGLGTVDSKNIVFRIVSSNLDASDPDKYNSNALIIDGETTLLPSVVITQPFGIDKKWIIQDTESMVDLSFTPISRNTRTLNVIVLRTTYSSVYGTFDGVLLTKTGEKIILKDFPGLAYKNIVRT